MMSSLWAHAAPAAATALLLAQAGAKVLLIDRQTLGSDTISTHALMRTGVLQLDRWGLLQRLVPEDTPPIGVTTFHYSSEQVRVAIQPEHGVHHLYAPRRTVLDRILVEAAEAAGAEVQHGVVLSTLQFDSSGQVIGALLRHGSNGERGVSADLVIGADGRNSTVAKLVGAETYREGRASSAIVYGYFDGLRNDGLHWYFGDRAAAGVIPTNHGQHCVFGGLPQDQFAAALRGNTERGFLGLLERCCPDLRAAVEGATMAGRLRGFSGARGFLRRPAGPGWALVGDAGYFKDPLTAHGITDALRDAELLARALLEYGPHNMAVYQRERDFLSIPFFEVTDAIASFKWTMDEIKALHAEPECSDEDRSELHGTAASCAQQGRVKAQEEPMSMQGSPWSGTIAGRPEVGATAERVRQTSMRDVEMFTEMTGDRNPIHYDADLAAKSPFGGLIVQGGVTTGLLNAVVAEDLPGPGTVFLETSWRFVKAVPVGEIITAKVKIEHVREDKPICKIETVVRNARGENCVVGTATTYTMPLLHPVGQSVGRQGGMSVGRSAGRGAPRCNPAQRSCVVSANAGLLDDFVGGNQQRLGYRDAHLLRCFHVDAELEHARRLYRQVARLLAVQDTADVAGGSPELIGRAEPVCDQRARR